MIRRNLSDCRNGLVNHALHGLCLGDQRPVTSPGLQVRCQQRDIHLERTQALPKVIVQLPRDAMPTAVNSPSRRRSRRSR